MQRSGLDVAVQALDVVAPAQLLSRHSRHDDRGAPRRDGNIARVLEHVAARERDDHPRHDAFAGAAQGL
jgi:hypothetical protein